MFKVLILEKYIAKFIFMATGLTALILAVVLLLVDLLGELKNVGEGDYGLSQALLFVLMRLPAELYQFTPILVLLGCMMGLSTLSASREIAVMRSSGFSIKQIMKSVLMAAIVLLVALCFFGEYVAPKWSYTAEVHRGYAKNAGQAVITSAGVWFHVDDNFIHIENVVDKTLLEKVSRYQFDDRHRLRAAYFAKKLILKNEKWVMYDAVKTTFYADRAKSETLENGPFGLNFNANLLGMGLVDASEMSLTKLHRYTQFLEQNGLQANTYQYEFWQRVLQPLASIIMVFLALPFVLSTFNNTSLGWRMLIAILVGFAFFILKACLGQLSVVYQIPPFLAAAFPLLLFSVFAVVLTRKLVRC